MFCVLLQAQNLAPTEDKALINLVVTDTKGNPLSGETVLLTAQKDRKVYQGHTDKAGKLSFMLPEGDTYEILYKNITQDVRYDDLTILAEEGAYTFELELMFEPGTVVVLDNVEYDSGKATLRPISYKTLNALVEYMKIKDGVEIEISGHTDSKGLNDANIILSQTRAEGVRSYLISKGISANRIIAVGYGATMPIAANENADGSDNPEGRQKNRRTEVRIIKEQE